MAIFLAVTSRFLQINDAINLHKSLLTARQGFFFVNNKDAYGVHDRQVSNYLCVFEKFFKHDLVKVRIYY